jgi:hypothetical protein
MNTLYILYGLLLLGLLVTIGFLYSYIFYKGEIHLFLGKAIGDDCFSELVGQCGTDAFCKEGKCTKKEDSV